MAAFLVLIDNGILILRLLYLAEVVFEDLFERISWILALTFFAFLLSPLYGFKFKTLFGSRGVFIEYWRWLRCNSIHVKQWTSRRMIAVCFKAANRAWRWCKAHLNCLFLLCLDGFLSILVLGFHRDDHLNNIFVHLVYGLIKMCLLLLEWGTPLLLFFLLPINCRPLGWVMQDTIFFAFGSPLLYGLIIAFFWLIYNMFRWWIKLLFQALGHLRYPTIRMRRCFEFVDVSLVLIAASFRDHRAGLFVFCLEPFSTQVLGLYIGRLIKALGILLSFSFIDLQGHA